MIEIISKTHKTFEFNKNPEKRSWEKTNRFPQCNYQSCQACVMYSISRLPKKLVIYNSSITGYRSIIAYF